jgi:hypothetical protein
MGLLSALQSGFWYIIAATVLGFPRFGAVLPGLAGVNGGVRAEAGPAIFLPVFAPTGFETRFTQSTNGWQIVDKGGSGRITQAGNVALTKNGYRLSTPAIAKSDLYTSYVSHGKTYRGSGGEISTTQQVHFGHFEASMRTSRPSGAVAGFFVYLSDENEIDIEILSRQNDLVAGQGIVNFTVYLPNGRKRTGSIPLVDHRGKKLAPWKKFFTYGFDWRPEGISWYVDRKLVALQTCQDEKARAIPAAQCFTGAESVPQLPGSLVFNNWTNGDSSWSGAQPTKDALMFVRSVSYKPFGVAQQHASVEERLPRAGERPPGTESLLYRAVRERVHVRHRGRSQTAQIVTALEHRNQPAAGVRARDLQQNSG